MSKEALDDLKYLGKRLKGILELVPLLENYASIGNMISEKKQELLRVEQEINGVKLTLKKKTEEVEVRDQEISSFLEDAKRDAETIVSKAKEESDNVLNKMREQYGQEEQKYKEEAKKAKEDLLLAYTTLKESQEQIRSKTKILEDLRQQIEELRSRFK